MKFDTQLAADILLPKYESLANDIRNSTKNDLSQSPFKDAPDTSLFSEDSFEKQKPILTGFQNENFSDAYDTLNSGESVARYENYLAGTDNMDRLGKEQSGWEQLGYGAIKWLGKTGTAALGGTVGSIYGIGQMISEGSLKASYDNDFSRYLMDLDTKMNYKLPNYYTKSAQDLGFFGQLTQDTGNFIGDKVLGGLAFTTGAIVSEGIWAAATGGASIATSATRLATAGGWGIKALGLTKVASALNKYKEWVRPVVYQAFDKSKKTAIIAGQVADAFNTARFAYTSAGFEAGIEALHFRKEAQENFRNSFEKINGRPITAEDEREFNRQLDNTSNSVYAANLLLVGSSNLVTLGKVFDLKSPFKTGFSDFMNKKAFGIVGEVVEGAPKLASRTTAQKVLRNAYYYGKSPIYEGAVEEGLQGVTSNVANQWIEAGYNPESIQEYAELIGMTYEGLTEQYGTKEGWVEIGVGMIIGALGGTVGAVSEMKSEEEKALFSASFDDTFQAKTMAENFLAASRMQVFNQEAKTAEQRGQLVKASLAGNKTILAQLNAEYQKSGDVMGLVEQNRVALETLTDEQFLAAGIEKEQIEDYKKQTIESYDKLARQFKQNRKFAEYTIGRSNLVGLEEIVGGDISTTLKTNNKESLVQALTYTLTMGENASALMVDIKSRIREEAGDVASKTLSTIEKLQTAKAETKQKVDENRAQIKALEAERIGLERELLKLQNAPKPTEKDATRGLEYSRISDRIIEIGQIVTDLRGQLRDIAEQLNTGTKIEGEVKAVEAGLDANKFDLTEEVNAKDLEDLETNIENFDNVLESLRTSNPRKYEYLKGLTNEFRDANKAFMDFQNTSIALSSGQINIKESNNWLSKMLNSKKSQDQFTKDWLVDILKNYQAFKSTATSNKVDGKEAITRDESEISFGQTRGFTIKPPTIEEQIASLEEQLREVESQIPTQNKPIRVFRTEGTGLGNLGVAYRGTGVYYALDKPFLTGREGETVTELTVVLPQNTLDTTTEEGSAIFAEIQKEAAETFNNSDKSKPFYDILRDVAVSKGYDGVISFIETEDQSQGREFVSYKGVLQDVGGNISDSEYNNFIDNGIVSEDRIANIAEKVKNNIQLNKRELEIFNDKTAEINKKLQELNKQQNEESNTEILLEGVQETGNENEARQKSKQLREEIARLKELAKGDRSDAQVLRDRLTAALKGKYRRLYQRVGEDYQEAFSKKPTQEELDEYLRLLEEGSNSKEFQFLKQKLGNWRLLDSVILGEDMSIADALEIMSQIEMQIEAEQTKTDITAEDAIETNIKDQSDGVRVDIAQNTHGSVTFTKKDGNLHLTHLKMSTIARNHGGELRMIENGQEIVNPTKEQADNALKGTVFILGDVTFTIIDGGVLQVKASAFTQDFQNKANMLLVGNTVQNMNWSSLDVYTEIDGKKVKMPSDFVQEGLQEQKIFDKKVGTKVRFVIRKTAYEKNLLEKLANIKGKGSKAEKQRAEIEQQLKDTLTIQVVDSNGTVISTLKRSRAGESESFTRIRERAYEKFQANRDIDYNVDLGIETEVAGIFPGSVNLRIENDVIVSKPFTERATEEVLATGYVLNNEFTLNTTFSEEINRDYVGRISKKNATQKIPVVIIRKGAYLYAYPMSLQKTTVPKGNIIRGILAENITMAEKAKKVNQAIIDNKTALGLRVTSDTLEQNAQQIIEAFDNFQSYKTADEIAQNDYNKKDLVNDALINIDLENMGQTISDPKLILDLKDSIVFEEELAVLYAQEVALVKQINDFVQDLYKKTYVNAPEYLLNTKDLSKNKAIDDIIDGANIIIKSRTGGEIREDNFAADGGNKNALLKIRDGIGKISTDWKNYLGEATLNKVKVFSNVYENLQEDIRKNKERIKNGKKNSSCPK